MTDFSFFKPLQKVHHFLNMTDTDTNDNRPYPIQPDQAGVYNIAYYIATSAADLITAGYYATTDEEYEHFDSFATQAEEDAVQDAIEDILHIDTGPGGYDYTYANFFTNVAKVEFLSLGSADIDDADILFLQNDKGSVVLDNDTFTGGTARSYAYNDTLVDHNFLFDVFDKEVDTWTSSERYGDIVFNTDAPVIWSAADTPGTAPFYAILHELGHSLGLRGDGDTPTEINDHRYTIMSGTKMPGMFTPDLTDQLLPSGLQLFDILAIQELYGREYGTRDTDTTYKVGTGEAFGATKDDPFIYTIWDGGDDLSGSGSGDTIDLTGYADATGAILDMRQGEFSSVGRAVDSNYNGGRGAGLAVDNLAISYYTIIENAIGTSQGDTIMGNAWDNVIEGGGGNDTIYGDSEANAAIADAGFHREDPTRSWDGDDAPAPAGDNSGNDTLDGGAGNDIMYSGAGDDTLIGGSGNDTLYGGDGTDTADYSNDSTAIEYDQSLTGASSVTQGGDTDTLHDVENITGTAQDDEFDLADVTGGTFDGGAGDDTVDYTITNAILDWSTGSTRVLNADGTLADTILNVAAVNDLDYAHSGLFPIDYDAYNTIMLDHTQDFDTPNFTTNEDYSFDYSAAGSAASFSNDMDTVQFGGLTHDLTQMHANGGGMFGTHHGDTIDGVYHSIRLGTGANTVTAYYGDGSITWRGGDTTVNDARFLSDIFLWEGLLSGDLTIGSAYDDSLTGDTYTFSVDITVSDVHGTAGTLKLKGMQLDINSSTQVDFKDDGYIEFTYDNGLDYAFVDAPSAVSDLYGTQGVDTLDGRAATDQTFHLKAGDDDFDGDTGEDTVYGALGDDTLDGAGGNDKLYGGLGDDTINGGDDHDLIHGNEGDDILNGNDGQDTIYGHDGDDAISGGDELDTIYGGAGDDTITDDGTTQDVIQGEEGDDYIEGGAGNDSLYGGDGEDEIYGEDGGDFLYGDDGYDYIEGGLGNDVIEGGKHADILKGDAGIDTLRGDDGSDELHGGTGDDDLYGGNGNDVLYGDDGEDDLEGDNGRDEVHGGAGDDDVGGGDGNDTLYGDAGADVLTGDRGNDIAYGGDDDDTLHGGDGKDRLYGEDGVDTLNGGNDDDKLYGGIGNDTLNGDAGDDRIYGGAGNDTIDGGTGRDSIDFSQAANSVSVDLGWFGGATVFDDGDGGQDSLTGIEDVIGSRSADDITGDGNDNTFAGKEGDDTLDGAGGTDTADYSTAQGAIDVDLDNEVAADDGDGGTDTLIDIENVIGSTYDDVIAGDTNANKLEGGGGDDTISGDSGDDELFGGYGADTLEGDNGDDTLKGEAGDDTLYGGSGSDTLDGGDGIDTADYSAASGIVWADLTAGNTTNDGDGAGTDTFVDIENIIGSGFDDILTGDTNANTLEGGAGDDTLEGGAGDDALDGGAGTDTVNYASAAAGITVDLSAGTASDDGDGGSDTLAAIEDVIGSTFNDTITGDANDNDLDGAAGDDTFVGGAGNDTFDGGAGNDILDYSAVASGVTVNYATGVVSDDGEGGSDTFTNIEGILLSGNDDTITGDANNNTFGGGAGNDTLNGADGDDTLIGGAGDDTLDGDGGTDTADYSAATSGVTVSLSAGTATGEGSDTLVEIENVIGSANDDSLTGDAFVNTVTAGDGIDTVYGLGGDDLIYGGEDGDFIYGGNDNDTIYGDAGDDYIHGGAGNDIIYGGAGADEILGVGGNDTIYGQGGDDEIYGGTDAETIYGGAGDDYINGSADNDTLYGDDGADELIGGGGDDTLFGGAGDDELHGGADTDTVSYISAAAGVTVDLTLATNQASDDGDGGVDIISNVENIIGSAFADMIAGDSGANTLDGDGGNDTLSGGAGDDTLNGGNGTDTADYSNAVNGVTVDLSGGTPGTSAGGDGDGGTDTFTSIENVTGSANQDDITGDSTANVLIGGDDIDTISGGGGDDRILGGDGVDTLYGGNGNDELYGGLGDDYIEGGSGDDLIYGGAGSDEMYGQGGNDTIFGQGGDDEIYGGLDDELLKGGGGEDIVSGSAGNDSVYGGADSDTVSGGNGNDFVYGEDGDDNVANGGLVRGNAGDDFIDGGLGTDDLWGDAGADMFNFSNTISLDTVKDFSTGDGDALNASDVLTGLDPQNYDITKWVQLTDDGTDSTLSVDVNGNGTNWVAIATIEGVTGITDEAALEASGNLIVV